MRLTVPSSLPGLAFAVVAPCPGVALAIPARRSRRDRERKGSRRGHRWKGSSAEAPKARASWSSGLCSHRTASRILEGNGDGEGEEGVPARIEGEGEKTTYLTRRGAPTQRCRRCLAVLVPRTIVRLAAAAGEEEEALKRSTKDAASASVAAGGGCAAAGAWGRGGAAESADGLTEAVRRDAARGVPPLGERKRCSRSMGREGARESAELTEAARLFF